MRLALYRPLEVTCPFTDVSVAVAVVSSAVLLGAVLLAVVLAVDAVVPSRLEMPHWGWDGLQRAAR